MPRRKFIKHKKRKTSRWGVYSAAGSQLYKDVKFLKSVINPELKYYDFSSGAQTPANTGVMLWMSTMTQGSTGTTRIGNSIKLNSFTHKVTCTQSLAAAESFVRVCVFIDTETRAALPALTDVLLNANVTSMLNMTNAKRFKILYNKVFAFSINGTTAYEDEFYKKFTNNQHMRWDTSGSSAQANVDEGHVYLLLLSTEATNVPTVALQARFRFYDN